MNYYENFDNTKGLGAVANNKMLNKESNVQVCDAIDDH